eukprot:4468211-Amphidinium_carterae.1
MPTHDGVTDGWPLLTDFGASQSFKSFTSGQALTPSDEIRTSAWTPEYAAPEVRACHGSQQSIKSDMYAWAMTVKRVAPTPVQEPLERLLAECLSEDPSARPADFMEISSRLEQPSYVAWGGELARLQFGEELSALRQSYEAALQAATFLAQERETWMRFGLCSREEAADAHFVVNRACFRSDKPDGQLRALQRSIQLFPKHATRPECLLYLGNTYEVLGDYEKRIPPPRARLEEALKDLEDLPLARTHLTRAVRILERSDQPVSHPHAVGIRRNLRSIEARLQYERVWRSLRSVEEARPFGEGE